MTASIGAQHFGGVILHGNGRAHGGNIVAHDVRGTEAIKGFAEGDLGDAFLRGVQKKEANECRPNPEREGNVERCPGAKKNHGVGDQPSAGAGDASSLGKILGSSPNAAPENSSAALREPGP